MTSKFLRVITYTTAVITFGILIFLIAYILVMGIPNLKLSMFAWEYNSDNVSLVPAFISTIIMAFFSLITAVPLGLGAAIYLVEYAKPGSKIVKVVRATTETLSGIPSIVYGLFGMLFFVTYLEFNYSLISGALTLSIMILPLIIRSAEEAIMAVSQSYREGSFGLGAGRLRTTMKVVLPGAANGILAGVILAVGRIVGETAALIYTSGTVAQIPGVTDNTNLFFSSARTLSVHMKVLSGEGLHVGESYATAVVLLVCVIGINAAAAALAKRVSKRASPN